MKKVSLVFLVLLLVVLVSIISIFPNKCFAKSITNNNGINITEEEYNNFSKVYSEGYIMTMTKETYEKLKNLNYDDIIKETIYLETTYNPHLNVSTEKIITKEEYDNFEVAMPLVNSDAAYIENTAKRLDLILMGDDYYNHVVFSAVWKYIPKTRVYDVIGIRGEYFGFRNGSQVGEQIFKTNGQYDQVHYAWDGNRIKRADNGFGFAMNIVNNDIDYLELTADCDVYETGTHPTLFAAYEHALNNVSLDDALSFTLGGGGLGNVFIYPYSISSKYDGETGLRLQF